MVSSATPALNSCIKSFALFSVHGVLVGGLRRTLSREELSSAFEMLASDTFLCLIYSTLLYFFDEHIAASRYFSVNLIPSSNFTAWVASRAAQLDFAWSSISKDAPHMFEWHSSRCTQQR